MLKHATFTSNSVDETQSVAAQLGRAMHDGDVIALTGDLGAGKTHFTQGIAASLGIEEPVTSPTFNIIYGYASGRIPLYHFDLYRLEDASELEDIDFYALTDSASAGASVIEWSDKFVDELPEDRLDVSITRNSDGSRMISMTSTGTRSGSLLENVCGFAL